MSIEKENVIDLHIHTIYSDGSETPESIIKEAIAKKIKTISFTDHNSIQVYQKLQYDKKQITVIPGIELSTEYPVSLHILGYGICLENEQLKRAIKRLEFSYLKSVSLLYRKCISKYPNIADNNQLKLKLSRVNIAKQTVKAGYFENIEEALEEIDYEKLQCPKPSRLSSKEAIELIKKAGGIPVLAHPCKLENKGINLEQLIDEFVSYGLEGIECFYPLHSKEQQNRYVAMAHKRKLCCSGGSDYHGRNKKDIYLGVYSDLIIGEELSIIKCLNGRY